MTAIDPGAIERLDQAGMLADIVAQPLQLEDALWRAESAGLPAAEAPGGLLVCGMGGSAIGADLAPRRARRSRDAAAARAARLLARPAG